MLAYACAKASTMSILQSVMTKESSRKDQTNVFAQVAIIVASLCSSLSVRIFLSSRMSLKIRTKRTARITLMPPRPSTFANSKTISK